MLERFIRGSDNGHAYLDEAGKKECEVSKIWIICICIIICIICILFATQFNKNIHSEGQGHMTEHTDPNTET